LQYFQLIYREVLVKFSLSIGGSSL